MSYDVSYSWLKSLAESGQGARQQDLYGRRGPAITTAYAENLTECTHLDAACYSEGEVGLKSLIEADDIQTAIAKDPWVTKEKLLQKVATSPVYDDLDKIIDVDYSLVDINAYSMKEAFFPPFTRFTGVLQTILHRDVARLSVQMRFLRGPSFHGANMRYAASTGVVEHVARLKSNMA